MFLFRGASTSVGIGLLARVALTDGAPRQATVLAGAFEVTTANAEQFVIDEFVRQALTKTIAVQAEIDEIEIHIDARKSGGLFDEMEESRETVEVRYEAIADDVFQRESAALVLSQLSAAQVSDAFTKHLVEAGHSSQLPAVFNATVRAVAQPRVGRVSVRRWRARQPKVSVGGAPVPLPFEAVTHTSSSAATQRHAAAPPADDADQAPTGGGFCCMMAVDGGDICGTCFPIAMASHDSECGQSEDSCESCGDGATWCQGASLQLASQGGVKVLARVMQDGTADKHAKTSLLASVIVGSVFGGIAVAAVALVWLCPDQARQAGEGLRASAHSLVGRCWRIEPAAKAVSQADRSPATPGPVRAEPQSPLSPPAERVLWADDV